MPFHRTQLTTNKKRDEDFLQQIDSKGIRPERYSLHKIELFNRSFFVLKVMSRTVQNTYTAVNMILTVRKQEQNRIQTKEAKQEP